MEMNLPSEYFVLPDELAQAAGLRRATNRKQSATKNEQFIHTCLHLLILPMKLDHE